MMRRRKTKNELRKAIKHLKKMNKYYNRIEKNRLKGELPNPLDLKKAYQNWMKAAKELIIIDKKMEKYEKTIKELYKKTKRLL